MPDPTVPAVSSVVQAALSEALQVLVAAVGTIKALPQNLPNPDRPVVLSGTLLPPATQAASAAPQSPLATIQTALGDLTIALDKAVTAGPVTIQIQPGSPPTATVLVTALAASSSQATILQPDTEVLVPANPAVILPTATVVPTSPVVGQVIQTLFIPAVAVTAEATAATTTAAESTPNALPASLPISTSLLAQTAASEALPTVPPVVSVPALPQAFQILDIGKAGTPAAVTFPTVPSQVETGRSVLPAPLSPAFVTPPMPVLPSQQSQPLLVQRAAPATSVTFPTVDEAPVSSAPSPPSTSAAVPVTAATPPAGNTALVPPLVIATVIASTAAQQPVLAVPAGTLIVNQPLAVSPGQTLILQPLTVQQAGQLTNPLPVLSPPGQGTWPALAEGLSLLAGSPAAQSLMRFIPALDQDFVAGLVAYLTKETGSDKQANLETSSIIRDLKVLASLPGLHATLGQLQSEVLGKGSPAITSQNWHSYPVPFQTDSGLSLIQVYVRQQPERGHGEDGQAADRQNTTRFLLEVHPSQLGPVQLDGLIRKGLEAQTHLDLIVRSEALILPEDASELQGLFIQSLESTGLTGRLSFQEGRDNFVQAEGSVGMQIRA